MNQINPWMKAWDNAEKTQMSAAKGKVKWQKNMKNAYEFLNGSHRYERTFSDQKVGEFKIMNGRDAKELNDNLFAVYLKAMDKNIKDRSLERWCLVEKFVSESACM
jgi:hypothetical protein